MKTFKGILASLIFALNTVVMVSVLLVFALLKLLLPIPFIRVALSRLLVWIAESWIWVNSTGHRLIHGNKIELKDMPELSKDQWYLVVANHQSTADIPIIQAAFNRKIPFLKFFFKTRVDLGPLVGIGLVGIGFSFHETLQTGLSGKTPSFAW